jgi:hypothetical protein
LIQAHVYPFFKASEVGEMLAPRQWAAGDPAFQRMN